jgi:hypothetical protein
MDFEFSEDQKIFRDSFRDFLENEIAPIADEKEKIGKPATTEEAIDLNKRFKKIGISPDIEDIGGFASDLSTVGLVAEELGRVSPSVALIMGYSMAIPAVIQFLPDGMDLKERLLPKMKRSEIVATYSLTEPEAGSDSRAIKSTAVLDGDEYVINGSKTWASNGPISNLALLVAKVESGDQEMFFIDREQSPYDSSELGHLGLKFGSTGELFLEDCRVPAENTLTNVIGGIMPNIGEIMKDLEMPSDSHVMDLLGMMNPVSLVLAFLRIGMAFMATGISQACLEASVNYSKERVAFGRPIGKFQLIQDMLCKIATITETSRLLGYKALDLAARGSPEFRMTSSMAKAYACKEVVDAASYAIEIHGGMGLSDELPIERYFRDARMMSVPDGTTNMNTLVVGRELLGPGYSAYV